MKPKLTYELIDRMCELKADGLSNKDICQAVGIAESTLYRWLANPDTKLKRALEERLKKTEAEYKQALLNTIRAAALAKNANWTAAAWLLERKYPDDYAQNRQRAKEPDAAPRIVLGVSVGQAEGDAAEVTVTAGAGGGDAEGDCAAGAEDGGDAQAEDGGDGEGR